MFRIAHPGGIPITDLGKGVSRQVMSYDASSMAVAVHFEKGAIGTQHAHPHAQTTYVKSGRFLFVVEGVPCPVETGDTITFSPNEMHGTTCLEMGTLIDFFSPCREDFL